MAQRGKLFSRRVWEPYLFISPWLAGFCLFMLFPILFSLVLSFARWDMISPTAEYVGLANFERMILRDEYFWKSLRVTALYALGSVPLGLAGSLALAVLLNRPVPGQNYFRTIFYVPAVVSGVTVAILWMGILNPQFGLINDWLARLLGPLGVRHDDLPRWLFSSRWALISIILMNLWSIGPGALIFLAGLSAIPTQLYEAARIDGAGRWGVFRNVTLPLLTPMILFNLIMSVIGSFQVFAQGYIMTGGGPRQSTLFLVLYIWQRAFWDFQVGYASAMAWVLFLVILSLTLIVLRTSRRWVHYGGDA